MTSKEKLLQLRHDFYNKDELNYDSIDYFTSIYKDLEILERYKNIEKDLEVLEILKHHIHLIDSKLKNDSLTIEIAFIEASGFVLKNSKVYDLLKEWVIYND